MNIGLAIRKIRTELSIKQYALAASCGISHTSLCLIENGTKLPSNVTFTRICEELDVPEELIYILAIEEGDVPQSMAETYRQVHPIISGMAVLGIKNQAVNKNCCVTAA